MKIKIINTTILSLIFALILTGCTDLETQVTDSIPTDTEGEFSGDPAALLNSAYGALGNFTQQDDIYSLYEHTSDELIGPTRGTDWGDNGVWRLLHTHNWDPLHRYVINSWNELNSSAFTCNQVLASDPSPGQAAQAKFLRAFYMFYVMDLYGKVPFREVGEGVDVDPRVFTRTEAFDFIVNDLEEAIPDLADGSPSSDPNVATKSAAHALLAKLYLNKAIYETTSSEGTPNFAAEDMNKVIEYADAVADAGYSLEDDGYFTIFSETSDQELILTVRNSAGTPQNRWFMTLHYNQKPSGWNGFTTLADFYNKFEPDEQRIGEVPEEGLGRGFLIGQQYGPEGEALKDRPGNPLVFTPEVMLVGNNERTGIRVIKYHPSDAGDYILLRYADVYLMKIEALLRGGSPAGNETAQSMLDELRALRGASSIPANLDNLLDERGRELYWEGWRRQDQIRFGTYDDTWEGKTVTDPARALFPVPQQALDTNPNLIQNPGY